MRHSTRYANGSEFIFDSETQCIEMNFPPRTTNKPFFLSTLAELKEHFDETERNWRLACNSQKVYWLLNYQNFDVKPDLRDAYMARIGKIINEMSIHTIRYNANLLQSSAIRFSAMKIHGPINLYESREEALAALDSLRKGTGKQGAR